MSRKPLVPTLFAIAVATLGCAPEAPQEEEVELRWLPEATDERFQAIEDQFAGFSQTMWEVGLRYRDLHWAVEDRNWAYAEYQAENIESALESGVVRRPGREASTREHFLDEPLPAFLDAVASEEPEAIEAAFDDLTVACNRCHVAEDMEFVIIEPPPERSTVVAPRNGAP